MKLNEEKIVNYLKENIGESISTYWIIKESEAYEGDCEKLEPLQLMELHDDVMNIAEKNGYKFDFSEYDNMLVGMPYVLDGVIELQETDDERSFMNQNRAIVKRSYKGIEEDLIYRNKATGYYLPAENTVSVYDRETDNVVIEDTMVYLRNEELPEKRTYTVSRSVLDKIRKAIVKSGVLSIRSFEGVNYCVHDGENNRFYFSAEGKRKYIECDNFYLLYQNCKKDSNPGKVMKLVDRIEDILDKENCD